MSVSSIFLNEYFSLILKPWNPQIMLGVMREGDMYLITTSHGLTKFKEDTSLSFYID